MTLEEPNRGTTRQSRPGFSEVGRKPTRPASNAVAQQKSTSLNRKYENFKGINVHIHSLKMMRCQSNFMVSPRVTPIAERCIAGRR